MSVSLCVCVVCVSVVQELRETMTQSLLNININCNFRELCIDPPVASVSRWEAHMLGVIRPFEA